jgi:hypothetical protein
MTAEIIQQLQNLIVIGDDAGARQFAIEHIKEFPKEIRNKIIFAFFQEAVKKDTQVKEAQSEAADEALTALKDLEKDKKNLGEKQRIVELHQKINGE